MRHPGVLEERSGRFAGHAWRSQQTEVRMPVSITADSVLFGSKSIRGRQFTGLVEAHLARVRPGQRTWRPRRCACTQAISIRRRYPTSSAASIGGAATRSMPLGSSSTMTRWNSRPVFGMPRPCWRVRHATWAQRLRS